MAALAKKAALAKLLKETLNLEFSDAKTAVTPVTIGPDPPACSGRLAVVEAKEPTDALAAVCAGRLGPLICFYHRQAA